MWTREQAAAFYESYEWAEVRYQVLRASNGRCELCGRSKHDTYEDGAPVILNVDHVKPLRRFPELRAELSNLAVLCRRCNKGKSDHHVDDWRAPDHPHRP